MTCFDRAVLYLFRTVLGAKQYKIGVLLPIDCEVGRPNMASYVCYGHGFAEVEKLSNHLEPNAVTT